MTKNKRRTITQRVNSVGLIFIIDIILTAVSFIASYGICTSIWPELRGDKMLIQLPVIIAISCLIFLAIGTSKGFVKYDRVTEVYKIFNAICLANVLTIVLIVVHGSVVMDSDNSFLIPLSIIIVHSFLSFAALVASRYLYRKAYQGSKEKLNPAIKVLLVSTGRQADDFISAFERTYQEDYIVAGVVFIDESNERIQSQIPVISKNSLSKEIIEEFGISQMIVAKAGHFDPNVNELLTKMIELPVKVKIADLSIHLGKKEADLQLSGMDELRVEDLYSKERKNSCAVEKDLALFYSNKKILVLGAGGCVGKELIKRLMKYSYKHILMLDKSDDSLFNLKQELNSKKASHTSLILADILDKPRMQQVFNEFAPDIVINATGYKIYDFTKDNLYEALRLNVLGNKILSELAIRSKVQKYVNLSSNFRRYDFANSLASERIGEIYLNCHNDSEETDFINIRFGDVLESPSSLVNVFKTQLANGGPLKVSYEEATTSFIAVNELVGLISQAIATADGGDIVTVKMGERIKEMDLARQIIRFSKFEYKKDIDISIGNKREDYPWSNMPYPFQAKKDTSILESERLIFRCEDQFDRSQMKDKINELCLENMFFNKNVTILMDNILHYRSHSDRYAKANKPEISNTIHDPYSFTVTRLEG
ncbi:SDR family NAD(P)-dependent oxidoreductase [Poritiphilus flavus]|uniref:SDR family NAD(P)-dependent oxidoreductase n=1 Tax=Poritiphilus flavus TaxID=2697053 RepID=A0A6L9E9X1_9FLAO|nr:SDR family NAD(P)-dependent oxidoreductase [Poritiphilus flavus]NAS11510.1 SDR family NAD(P)-dependent oxidoreductase [Poritiphilus flavus]